MSNPSPADVIRKAREHNISRAEAKRVIAATERFDALKEAKARAREDSIIRRRDTK
jgi:hypothetical protein